MKIERFRDLLRRPGAWLVALWLVLALGAPLVAQNPPAVVGRIEGDDVAVKGQVSLVRTGARKSVELASGSEVTLPAGQARLTLTDGSEIDICGPAQFSVLRSGDAVTVALNHGRLHARLSPTAPLAVYSPVVVLTPISIDGRAREAVIGLEPQGGMCVQTLHGALRLEQQLTGTSIVVPQASEVALPEGHVDALREAPGSCRCDVVLVEDRPQPPPAKITTASARTETEKKPDAAPAVEDPKWTVVMPPLSFDASAPEPPPVRPEVALLIREVQVRPALIFRGRVEDRAAAKPPAVKAEAKQKTESGPKKEGFFQKVGGFFKRLFGGKSKS
jgi:ferric-dicitrate binding protein FerR (iron transport regulator)